MKVVIGDATLYLGDAYEIAPTLGFFDGLVTDPQYDFKTSGGGKMRKERKCLEKIIEKGLDQGFDHRIINPLLYRSLAVFCHNDQLHKLLPFIAGSFKRHVLCTWEKSNPMPVANKNFQADLEPYIFAWNNGGHPVGELADKKRTIRTTNGKSKFDHPTVKPLEVMNKIVKNINGNRILDTFMGTGSTGIAALSQGKEFVGIERDQEYFEIAVKRFEDFYCFSKSNE